MGSRRRSRTSRARRHASERRRVRAGALAADARDLPIVFLTARDAVEDRLRGFGLGADDYLVKPFALEELLARVRAVLRRTGRLGAAIEVGDVVVDSRRALPPAPARRSS